ncbi:MAG: hypothetical protein RLZZ517_615 [Candidatus Parcubacteria bacterium]|jgi:type I restriction enzyme S subunit
MKKIWQTKNIEDCIEKVIYTSKIQRKDFLESGDFPIVSQEQEFINGYWNNRKDILSVKKPLVVFGDHTQILKFIDFDFVLGADGVKILQPKEFLYPKYFYYFLQNINLRSLGYARHYRLLKEKDISYPESIAEQKRIVKILDSTFEKLENAKQNTEKNLQNSKDVFESYLKSIFVNTNKDWEEKTLGDIGKPSMCKRILKHQTSSVGEIPFYKIGTFGKTPNAFISKEIYDEFRSKYSFPKKGDILISASGTIGRRVRYDGEPAFFQDSNIVWISNDEKQVLNDYLYVFYEFCDWQPSKGATIARLYNSDLTSIKISFPKSIQEQKFIIEKLDQLSSQTKRLESLYKKKIQYIEELKKSILQKAFSGEL